MDLKIRKLVNFDEVTLIEGGRDATPPLRLFAVAAVVRNPWAERGYVDDLKPEIRAFAPILGKLLTDRIVALAGGARITSPFSSRSAMRPQIMNWLWPSAVRPAAGRTTA